VSVTVDVERLETEDISCIADRIFGGSTCQRDLDERLFDFIRALHANGTAVRRQGTVTWYDKPYTGPGIAMRPGPHHIVISDWSFES
jgi:hypothetical protein